MLYIIHIHMKLPNSVRCFHSIYLYTMALSPIRGVADKKKNKKRGLNPTHQGFERRNQQWLRWHCWSTTTHPRCLPPALHNAISPVASATKLSYGSLMAAAISICVVSLIYNCSPFTPISSTLFRFPHIHSSFTHCLLHSIHSSKPWPSSYIAPIHL